MICKNPELSTRFGEVDVEPFGSSQPIGPGRTGSRGAAQRPNRRAEPRQRSGRNRRMKKVRRVVRTDFRSPSKAVKAMLHNEAFIQEVNYRLDSNACVLNL